MHAISKPPDNVQQEQQWFWMCCCPLIQLRAYSGAIPRWAPPAQHWKPCPPGGPKLLCSRWKDQHSPVLRAPRQRQLAAWLPELMAATVSSRLPCYKTVGPCCSRPRYLYPGLNDEAQLLTGVWGSSSLWLIDQLKRSRLFSSTVSRQACRYREESLVLACQVTIYSSIP